MFSFLRLSALAAAAMVVSGPALAQDAAAGAADFNQRCHSCHSVTPGQGPTQGPNLAGVVGRKAASTSFAYSDALKASGLTWTKATLDGFLAAPWKVVPGSRMLVATSDAKQRANLIAYLATTK
jgi:cytochrome c